MTNHWLNKENTIIGSLVDNFQCDTRTFAEGLKTAAAVVLSSGVTTTVFANRTELIEHLWYICGKRKYSAFYVPHTRTEFFWDCVVEAGIMDWLSWPCNHGQIIVCNEPIFESLEGEK